MFDSALPGVAELAGVDDTGLVSAISGWARVSAAAEARKLAAVAELVRRRCADEVHPDWCCDDWDAVATEVSAALMVGHGQASGQMDLAVMLRDRFPKVQARFLAGELSARTVSAIADRTYLVQDPDAVARLDGLIAGRAHRWGPLSQYKLLQAVDKWVAEVDPVAVIRAKARLRDRDFVVGDPNDETGTTSVWGRLSASDAALVRARVELMSRSVCEDDPRTLGQRRADALGAFGAGSLHLACRCDNPDCPAAVDDGRASNITVHIVADEEALAQAQAEAAAEAAEVADAAERCDTATEPAPKNSEPESAQPAHAPAAEPVPADEPEPAAPPRRRSVALIPGIPNGVIPTPLLAELLAHGATIRYVHTPDGHPEARYRPSTALDEFIRIRDLTCSFPGCDRPAMQADIDHSQPWPAGPTAPWNLHGLCRKHHHNKTFWARWTEQQDSDGSIVWTAPTGHTYTTRPLSGLLFPGWNTHTPKTGTTQPPAPPNPNKGTMMPLRKRTREQARADRIRTERAENQAHLGNDPPPF